MVLRVLDNIRCSPGQGLATTYHVSVSSSEGYEIHEYLAMEAFFLDHGRYDEWATLLTTDVIYRSSAHLFAASSADELRADGVCEYDHDFLVRYARRLGQTGGNSSKLRRCITNVIVATGPSHREFTVNSYLLITGTLDTSSESAVLAVERHDVLRRCQRSYRIQKREISFDRAGAHVARHARLL